MRRQRDHNREAQPRLPISRQLRTGRVAGPSHVENLDQTRWLPGSEPLRGSYSAFTPEAPLPLGLAFKKLLRRVQGQPEAGACPLVQSLKCTGGPGFSHAPVRRMMIGLMKRIAHAISGIGEKPALLTEGGLLLCPQGATHQDRQGGPPRGRTPAALKTSTCARPPSRTGLAAARSVRRGSRSPASSRGSPRRCSRSRPGSRSAC